MYISHLFEAVCSGGFGVIFVSFPKLLYIKNLNCLIRGDIYLSFSLGPSVHQGSGQTIASQAKLHFPQDELLWFRFLLSRNTDDIGAALYVVITPCFLPSVSRVNFPFHAVLFLMESVGFLAHCQGTIAKVQVPGGTS